MWMINGALGTALVSLNMATGALLFSSGLVSLTYGRKELEPGEGWARGLELCLGLACMVACVATIGGYGVMW